MPTFPGPKSMTAALLLGEEEARFLNLPEPEKKKACLES